MVCCASTVFFAHLDKPKENFENMHRHIYESSWKSNKFWIFFSAIVTYFFICGYSFFLLSSFTAAIAVCGSCLIYFSCHLKQICVNKNKNTQKKKRGKKKAKKKQQATYISNREHERKKYISSDNKNYKKCWWRGGLKAKPRPRRSQRRSKRYVCILICDLCARNSHKIRFTHTYLHFKGSATVCECDSVCVRVCVCVSALWNFFFGFGGSRAACDYQQQHHIFWRLRRFTLRMIDWCLSMPLRACVCVCVFPGIIIFVWVDWHSVWPASTENVIS